MRSLLATIILLAAGASLLLVGGIVIADEIATSTVEAGAVTDSRSHDHQIESEVMSVGGTVGNSENYILRGTATQAAVSDGNSESYVLEHGFWHSYCVPGDADFSAAVDIDDVVYLIAYIFSSGPAPVPMTCCGDADASCAVDIDDAVYLIGFIFTGGPVPQVSYYPCGLF